MMQMIMSFISEEIRKLQKTTRFYIINLNEKSCQFPKEYMGQFHTEIFRGSEVINFNCQILNSVGYFVFHFLENLINTEKY